MKNVLVLYSSKNTKGRKDATGAFIPEAKRFAKAHGVPKDQVVGIDCIGRSYAKRREQAFQIIHDTGAEAPLDCLACFCHGWPDGIQFGITREHVVNFAALLGRKMNPNAVVVLYACLTAENDERDLMHGQVGPGTDGGFADLLRDELVWYDVDRGWVDAHKTAGHVTWNPFVVRFTGKQVKFPIFGAEGGAWIVQPGSASWKNWIAALRSSRIDGLRYHFPFMSEAEIIKSLDGTA